MALSQWSEHWHHKESAQKELEDDYPQEVTSTIDNQTVVATKKVELPTADDFVMSDERIYYIIKPQTWGWDMPDNDTVSDSQAVEIDPKTGRFVSLTRQDTSGEWEWWTLAADDSLQEPHQQIVADIVSAMVERSFDRMDK